MGKRGGFIATPRPIVTSDLLADVRDYVRRCANLQVFEKKSARVKISQATVHVQCNDCKIVAQNFQNFSQNLYPLTTASV